MHAWPSRSRGMCGRVCSVELVFWPLRGVGCAPRVLACCASEPHPTRGSRQEAQAHLLPTRPVPPSRSAIGRAANASLPDTTHGRFRCRVGWGKCGLWPALPCPAAPRFLKQHPHSLPCAVANLERVCACYARTYKPPAKAQRTHRSPGPRFQTAWHAARLRGL